MREQIPQRLRPESCLSDLALESHLIGEPASGGQPPPSIDSHLATCERCQRRRSELAAAPAQMPDLLWWAGQTTSPTPADMAATNPAASGRVNVKRLKTRSVWGLGAGAVTFAMAAALVLTMRPKPFVPVEPIGDTRVKGTGFLLQMVARHADGKIERVFDDTVLHPNDQVQFIVTSATGGHVAVVGLDAARNVSVYFPDGQTKAALVASGTHELPVSIILDQTLGAERIIALLCPTTPDPVVLVRAGREALANGPAENARLNDPDLACQQTAMTVHKTPLQK